MLTAAFGGTQRLFEAVRVLLSRLCFRDMTVSTHGRRLTTIGLLVGAGIASPAVFSFTTPAAGSFGFDVYTTVVTDILDGPIGFVGGIALIVWGATQLMRNWMITITCIIAGTVLIKAVTILNSLGALA